MLCRRAVPPFHREDAYVRDARESLCHFVIANFLTASEVRIYGIGDKGDYRSLTFLHLPFPVAAGHATQKLMDSAGSAKRTSTWSRPPTQDIFTDLATVARP